MHFKCIWFSLDLLTIIYYAFIFLLKAKPSLCVLAVEYCFKGSNRYSGNPSFFFYVLPSLNLVFKHRLCLFIVTFFFLEKKTTNSLFDYVSQDLMCYK